MTIRSSLVRFARPPLEDHPAIRNVLKRADDSPARWHHAVASAAPEIIPPSPEAFFISITGRCNFRCVGCRYERDFMLGEALDLATVKVVLTDAREAGVRSVRLYGGEPLLHPDLPAMVRAGTELGLDMYVTTNGSLLDKRIDDLWAAGLRWLTIGFYGEAGTFAQYTQRPALVGRVAQSLARVRERYGKELSSSSTSSSSSRWRRWRRSRSRGASRSSTIWCCTSICMAIRFRSSLPVRTTNSPSDPKTNRRCASSSIASSNSRARTPSASRIRKRSCARSPTGC